MCKGPETGRTGVSGAEGKSVWLEPGRKEGYGSGHIKQQGLLRGSLEFHLRAVTARGAPYGILICVLGEPLQLGVKDELGRPDGPEA